MAKKVTKKKAASAKSGRAKVPLKKAAPKTPKTVKAAGKTTSKKAEVAPKAKAAAKTKTRKASSRKAPSSVRRPVQNAPKRVKSYLTKAELKHFKILLIEKLKQITGDVDHIEKEFLHRSRQDATGDLSSMPIHMADIGSDTYEQEFTLGLMASERKIVQEILMALRRIDEGTYGMCEGTGEPIPKARLEAYPWARYCVRYAEMIEKGQALEVRTDNYSTGTFAPSLAEGEDLDDDEDEDEESSADEEAYEEEEATYDFDDEDEDEDDEPFYN